MDESIVKLLRAYGDGTDAEPWAIEEICQSDQFNATVEAWQAIGQISIAYHAGNLPTIDKAAACNGDAAKFRGLLTRAAGLKSAIATLEMSVDIAAGTSHTSNRVRRAVAADLADVFVLLASAFGAPDA